MHNSLRPFAAGSKLVAMAIRLLSSPEDFAAYDTWIKGRKDGTLWQSLEWKTYQEALGREVKIYVDADEKTAAIVGSALVIIDRTTGGFSTWDIPRGPVGSDAENIMQAITEDAKKDKCLSVYFSPIQSLNFAHAKKSSRHEQPEATRMIDLTQSEDQILAQMHQKGRYNIKVAEKNGVKVEESKDIETYAALSKKTANRDRFRGASGKQYRTFLQSLPGSFLHLAWVNNEAIAGLIGVTWNGIGVYYYGASDHTHRALMAPYLLQWEAMKKCKNALCKTYDLFGIAPEGSDASHPWSGISDFKSKFGGNVIPYPHEQEITLRPGMKGLLQIKRKIFG